MPIVDYKRNAELSEIRFFNDNKISSKNKQLVKKFLVVYDVSPARKNIFLKHINLLLERTKDINKDMKDRDKINKIFKQLRDKLGISYYSTVVNVSSRFVRWLNDGDKPKGFKDIKNVKKSMQKRKLTPEDMVTWDECLKLTDATNNIMLKAIIATQIDGGFRPSEFVDLNYGDVSQKKDFILISVNGGKTGARNVILWRSVPYLLKWLQSHPTKRKNDPLWVQEGNSKGVVLRYNYRAISKRIELLAKKIKFDKPTDFYSFRHSACTLSKMDNVPEEIAAAKFGHTIEYYTETYGRLTTEDVIERFSKHYGLQREVKKIEQNRLCQRCDFVNVPGAEMCEKCGAALSLKKALEVEKENELLREQLAKMQQEQEGYKIEVKDFISRELKKQIKMAIQAR